jgi:large subunit ribosomal protein L20
MSRVKGSFKTRQRRKRWLKLAKGYRGVRGKSFRVARTQVMKSLSHAYRDRRKKKRLFRRLAILQINAKCRELGISYSRFMWGLGELKVKINRKELAEIACQNPEAFSELVNKAKKLIAS